MSETILLMIESKANRNMLKTWVEKKYDVLSFENAGDLESDFDLCIMDSAHLHNYHENIRKRKETISAVFLPFLLMVSKTRISSYRSRFRGVVDEVIFIPVEKIELAFRIDTLLRTRRLSLETLKLAITDPLTQLFNRRHFFDLTGREMMRLKRSGRRGCVFMMDIDHFKAVNDTYGHAMGDRVLQEVAACIGKNVRAYDVLARYGGEEFVLFLPDADMGEARSVAERIRMQVAAHPITLDTGKDITVTISIGCSETYPDEADVREAIRRADQALYQAKRTGRNKVVLFASPVNEKGDDMHIAAEKGN